jgi:DNA topoisomerase I
LLILHCEDHADTNNARQTLSGIFIGGVYSAEPPVKPTVEEQLTGQLTSACRVDTRCWLCEQPTAARIIDRGCRYSMAMSKRSPDPLLRKEVRSVGLVYVSDLQPGVRRVRRGKGFVYYNHAGRPITNPRELDRIRKLAIPPAYTDVWICANPRGHLQACGRDARGRKQYRYHPDWRSLRDHGKFDRLLAFGKALPALRKRVRRDLALQGLPCDKVLALVIRLLDETLIRVGNESYARDNHSYGLTTLRSRHLRQERGRLHLVFTGKSGKKRDVVLDDKRLIQIIRRVQQLPGQQLFQYLDDDGQRHPIDSTMVNRYLSEVVGNGEQCEFTAKDFRTWGGTVAAAGILCCTPLPAKGGEKARRTVLANAVKQVAERLGNTPAVCRKSYIAPQLLDAWLDGSLHGKIPASVAAHRGPLERATLRFMKKASQRDRDGARGATAAPRSAQ